MINWIKKNWRISISLAIGVVLILGILAIISGVGNTNYLASSSHSPTATSSNQIVTASPQITPTEQPAPTVLTTTPVSSAPVLTPIATFSATPTLNSPTKPVDLPPTATLGETVIPPTPTPLLLYKVTPAASQTILPGTLKLSPEERTALVKLDADINGLNASIDRLGSLMTAPHPEQASWFNSLGKETGYWQDLENYYKVNSMPLRVGSQVMPVWLSALARMGRAGQIFSQAYHNADGIAISQADQEVAFAQLEINQTSKIILTLRQK